VTAEDEEAARRAAEESKEHTAPVLPERLKFKGMKEALELLFMRASNAEGIRERIEAAMFFISTVSEMLDMEAEESENKDDKEDAKRLHEFVSGYKRPRFRRSLGVSQDGIAVRIIEEPGEEKNRHQFLPADYRAIVDLLDEGLAEHFIRDVVPWFTAAAQFAKKRGYLRPEGDKLGFLTGDINRPEPEEEEEAGTDEDTTEEQQDDDVLDVEGDGYS